jgi:lipopolysaccharide biosynthesis glycosyltransferase
MANEDVIHVVLAIYDPSGTYSRHAGVAAASIFERTQSSVCVHILHDDTLSPDNRAMFIETAETFGQKIEFHDVSPDMGKFGDMALQKARGSLSVGMLFRLLIPDLVAADKVIYLDSDVVVNMDIKQLWDIQLEDFSIAGVADDNFGKFSPVKLAMRLLGCDPHKYVNSGVLVMNLPRIREKYNLPAESGEWFKKQGYCSSMLDQDFINSRFRGDIANIDRKFNSGRRNGDISDTIIHATGGSKPWNSLEGSAMESLYWKSYLKTAWASRAGHEETVDLMLGAVKSSIWTHRHTTSCYLNIFRRFKNDIVMNDIVRIAVLLVKYLYGKVRNLVAG